MTDSLIKSVVEPLGIDYNLYISKVENDPVANVFFDNYSLFYDNVVYQRILEWVNLNFRPVFADSPELLENLKTNRSKYLKELIYLITPSIHLRFYHGNKTDASPQEIVDMLLDEIKILDRRYIVPSNNTFELVW